MPSHAVAQSCSGVEQALRLVPWRASSTLVSLSNIAEALSSTLQLLWTQPSEQGCWVHFPSSEPEERQVVEARGAGCVPQALMHLTPGDKVSALLPAPSLPCLGTQRACRIIVCNPK